MIGKARADHRAKLPLDREVDLRDEIDRSLLVDAHRRAEALDHHVTRADDGFDGGGQEQRIVLRH